MRIIIETNDERGRGEPPVQTSPEPGRMESVDAGAPPESLTQLSATQSPGSGGTGSSEVTDAGSPPGWLLEAVQGATPLSVEPEGEDISAGAAPDIMT